MIKNIITAGVTAFIVALIVVGLVGGNQPGPKAPSVQGITNYDSLTLSPTISAEGLKVGTSTSATLNNIFVGTCTLIGTDMSHPASTTLPYDCVTSGVVAGDVTFVQFATSSQGVSVNGWIIGGSKASTTNGYTSVLVSNFTGVARVPSTQSVGSSTAVQAYRVR